MSDKLFQSYVGSCDFNVGMLFSHDGYAFMLYDACQRAGIDFPIDYVFGCTPCALQGGRAAPFAFSREDIATITGRYRDMGVGCRLTMSNHNIDEDDLADPEARYLLDCINEVPNSGVICSSDRLAEFLRENYPGLELISSLVKPTVENTLGEESAEYYNGLFDLYDIVVVNSAKAYDDEFLDGIVHPDRVEFIANHRCRPNCKLSCGHYTTQTASARAASTGNQIAARQLEGKLVKINQECHILREGNPLANSLIDTDRIAELVQKGFKHYKIEGRDYPTQVMARDIGTWIFRPDGPYLALAMSLLKSVL